MDWRVIGNEPWIWICGWILSIIALFQCTYFAKKAWDLMKKAGLSRAQMLGVIRSGTITSFGPVFAQIFIMITLVIALTPGIAWQREGAAVGAVFTELVQASNAALGAGQTFGAPDFDVRGFANVIFVMNISCIGWLIACFFTKYLSVARQKLARGDPRWLSVLTICSTLGVFGYWTSGNLIKLGGFTVATISGMALCMFLFWFADVIRKPRLKEWALGIAVFAATFIGYFYAGG